MLNDQFKYTVAEKKPYQKRALSPVVLPDIASNSRLVGSVSSLQVGLIKGAGLKQIQERQNASNLESLAPLSPSTREKLFDSTFLNIMRREFIRHDGAQQGILNRKQVIKILKHISNSSSYHLSKPQIQDILYILAKKARESSIVKAELSLKSIKCVSSNVLKSPYEQLLPEGNQETKQEEVTAEKHMLNDSPIRKVKQDVFKQTILKFTQNQAGFTQSYAPYQISCSFIAQIKKMKWLVKLRATVLIFFSFCVVYVDRLQYYKDRICLNLQQLDIEAAFAFFNIRKSGFISFQEFELGIDLLIPKILVSPNIETETTQQTTPQLSLSELRHLKEAAQQLFYKADIDCDSKLSRYEFKKLIYPGNRVVPPKQTTITIQDIKLNFSNRPILTKKPSLLSTNFDGIVRVAGERTKEEQISSPRSPQQSEEPLAYIPKRFDISNHVRQCKIKFVIGNDKPQKQGRFNNTVVEGWYDRSQSKEKLTPGCECPQFFDSTVCFFQPGTPLELHIMVACTRN